MTRHVEPQTTDRQSEEEELRRPTDTTGENERVAMTDGAYLSEGRAFVPLRLGALSVKSNVGDFHLKTVVRLKNRMHRWDGFLYNIDLFPYVEHRLLAFIG